MAVVGSMTGTWGSATLADWARELAERVGTSAWVGRDEDARGCSDDLRCLARCAGGVGVLATSSRWCVIGGAWASVLAGWACEWRASTVTSWLSAWTLVHRWAVLRAVA